MTDNDKMLIHIPRGGQYIEILGHRIDGFDSFEAFCEYLKKCADMEDTINRQKAEIERLTINMNAFGLGMKREKERADRNLDNLKAVLDERANHSEDVKEFEEEIWRRDEALASIIWYNGHKEWLLDLADQLEAADGSYINPIDVSEWHTEKHCIWMLLVGMYGDWGTSIRGGWIEKTKECAEYIRKLCRDDDEEEEFTEGSKR